MAERLKAHVLKTCLGHTNVGSNPTPSARRFAIDDLQIVICKRELNWGGARVVEWGRLLSGYRGEILGRRFESCPPRFKKNVFLVERVFFQSQAPIEGMIFESCPPRFKKKRVREGTRF